MSFDEGKSILSGISGTDYSSTKSSKNKETVAFSISFNDSYHAEKVDGLLFFTLPNLTQGIEAVGIAEMPLKRITAIELPGSINEEYTFIIKRPKGFKVISPVNMTMVENELGVCCISQEAKEDNVIITRKLKINKAIIPSENYANFRQIVSLWNDRNLNKVVLKEE